jgi:hypothetical protein
MKVRLQSSSILTRPSRIHRKKARPNFPSAHVLENRETRIKLWVFFTLAVFLALRFQLSELLSREKSFRLF